MEDKLLKKAVQLRKDNNPHPAFTLLTDLLKANPNNPTINYQMDWTCDYIGKESKAVPFVGFRLISADSLVTY